MPDALVGDPGRLRQVILNLVGNAIKFTESGEVVVTVESDALTAEDAALRFIVSDTGIGIPPDKQWQIFGPFVQADASTTRRFGGTGLGLTISARLVELMGGRIWVASETGQGSRFSFVVRFARAPQSRGRRRGAGRAPGHACARRGRQPDGACGCSKTCWPNGTPCPARPARATPR